MNYFSSRDFNYSSETRTFSAEVSELKFRGNLCSGFYIKSARTGKQVLFLFDGADYADANKEDIAGWRFFCPGEGVSALIIND